MGKSVLALGLLVGMASLLLMAGGCGKVQPFSWTAFSSEFS